MTLMERRRAIMGQKKASGGLPSEYQEVEYIEFDNRGSANAYYFDTGISAVRPRRFRANVLWLRYITNKGDSKVIGSYGCGGICTLNGFFRIVAGGHSFNTTTIPITLNNLYEIDCNLINSTFELSVTSTDGTKTESYAQEGTDRGINLVIGGCSYSSSTVNSDFAGRFYGRVYVWDSNAMLGEFIPCYKKADDTVGYYNTITNEFITPSGSGNLPTKGPDV